MGLDGLERDFLNATGEKLARFGFRSRPRGQDFLRPMDAGQVAVHVGFVAHHRGVDAGVDVAVRFDAVEDLVNRSNPLLSSKEKTSTFTLGAELGNLEKGKPYRVRIATTEDIEPAAGQLVAKVETIGLPYLERYSDLHAAFEVLARDDREAWLHSPIHAARAKRACAILAVMGRHAELQAVAERKMSFLASLGDPSAGAFASFVAQLSAE